MYDFQGIPIPQHEVVQKLVDRLPADSFIECDNRTRELDALMCDVRDTSRQIVQLNELMRAKKRELKEMKAEINRRFREL